MKFDIIIPMGCYCASAQALKSVKKRSRSLPFDWVGPLSFDQAVRFLETGFEGFFEKEDLVKYEKDTKKNVGYVNTRNNLLFLHDFKEVAHFDEEYVQLREKYERRIKRIYQTIRDSKDILYLHVHTPDMMDRLPADEELQAALERLRKMYPEKITVCCLSIWRKRKRARPVLKKGTSAAASTITTVIVIGMPRLTRIFPASSISKRTWKRF